jgi:CheY-like chemotaxis protein
MNKEDLEKLARARLETKKALVLIIEDNPGQQQLYRLIQEHVGMIPCIVSSCTEGLEALKFLNFNLILLDLKMPDVSGVQCARKIQKIEQSRGKRTPIIAVTAHAMTGDRKKCMDVGMDDYISKPFSIEELKAKISIWAT